jgi:aminopeptidase N
LEIDQIFDHISYLKGSGTIRMLSHYLGVETFLNGAANYLKKHAYGNATTDDLWAALSEESKIDVGEFMVITHDSSVVNFTNNHTGSLDQEDWFPRHLRH